MAMRLLAFVLCALTSTVCFAQEGNEVAVPSTGEPVVLNDEIFEPIGNSMEIMMVNFYADWCRFSQMLKPVYAAAAKQLADTPNVRLGSINCEAPDTVQSREKNHISKYPTIKVYRRGVALKSEYRGQRSPEALVKYIQSLLAEPVLTVNDNDEIAGHVTKFKRAIIGHFNTDQHEHISPFTNVAHKLRDDCHFLIQKNSQQAGEKGGMVQFKSKTESSDFGGDMGNEDELTEWAKEHCSPLVREITFENGEELTEEGLPFLIMFHAPDDHDSIVKFTKVVKERFNNERGSINFIMADGHKFAHPLRHLGKSKKDLPVLAFDTFKHMYLFKKFDNIKRAGKLEKFVSDLHTGKLHHNFHNPGATQNDDDDGGALTLAEKIEDAEDAKNPDVVAEDLHEPVDHPSDAPNAHLPEDHPDHDDPMKPVPVKSVLKNLKPNENRYSFKRNADEF